jgi:2-amino-4-hydroxy-6-hydroxymethyldihydropteridine diphosphokinase
VRAFLGLGSNLGDRRATLRRAVGDLVELVAVSPVYETEPVGGPDQGAFLNIVVELDTRRSPHELLELCQQLERDAGRVRAERWGPRTLDVDVLWIDGVTVAEPELTVPHPRLLERNFVMRPLLDLDPTFMVAGWDPVAALGEVRRLGPL